MTTIYPKILYRADRTSQPVYSPEQERLARDGGFTQEYVHAEYPKLVYGCSGAIKGQTLEVCSQLEEQAATERGFSKDPNPELQYSRVGVVPVRSR